MKKVLVLGAGASKAYGYPVGQELRQQIIELRPDDARSVGIVSEFHNTAELEDFLKFQQAFRLSQLYSIDAFLARRPEFAQVGKLAIAAILLSKENEGNLFSEAAGKDHWYQYLFNSLAKDGWEEFSFDDLSVVTFNYDRSLELYLLMTMQATYNVSRDEASKRLKTLRIVHVYGCVCDALPGFAGYIKADGSLDPEKAAAAAGGLQVIPEGRTDSRTLIEARALLRKANAICFLGFGFDSMNVERLASDGACLRWVLGPQGHVLRRVVGTRRGMTDVEISRAYGALTQKPLSEDPTAFVDVGCTELLRRTGFLF